MATFPLHVLFFLLTPIALAFITHSLVWLCFRKNRKMTWRFAPVISLVVLNTLAWTICTLAFGQEGTMASYAILVGTCTLTECYWLLKK